jgi:hypothetical protein
MSKTNERGRIVPEQDTSTNLPVRRISEYGSGYFGNADADLWTAFQDAPLDVLKSVTITGDDCVPELGEMDGVATGYGDLDT